MSLTNACFKCIIKHVPHRENYDLLELPQKLYHDLERFRDSLRKYKFSDHVRDRDFFRSNKQYRRYKKKIQIRIDEWNWCMASRFPRKLYAHLMSLPATYPFGKREFTEVYVWRYPAEYYYTCRSCTNILYICDYEHLFIHKSKLLEFCQDIKNWCGKCILCPLFIFEPHQGFLIVI